MNSKNLAIFGGFVDEDGNPVKKTKYTHPYSYDAFVIYRNGVNEEINSTVYSDRLRMWDDKKLTHLMKKHCGTTGDYWDGIEPLKIQAFLRAWFDDSRLKLILVMQECNVSSGYPLWRFGFKTSKVL